MSWLVSNINDACNIGDQACGPKPYFPWLKDVPFVDVRASLDNFKGHSIILGGGGLAHEYLNDHITAIVDQAHEDGNEVIAWGVGTNHSIEREALYPIWLLDCDLIGIRDCGGADEQINSYRFVEQVYGTSCPSCMNPAFDTISDVTQDTVIYEHHDHPIELTGMPRMNNRHNVKDLPKVVEFLSSARRIITNSYHGAYWAMLVGRPVIIWRPFSTRFLYLRNQPPLCSDGNFTRAFENATVDLNYLRQERRRATNFSAMVLQMIE